MDQLHKAVDAITLIHHLLMGISGCLVALLSIAHLLRKARFLQGLQYIVNLSGAGLDALRRHFDARRKHPRLIRSADVVVCAALYVLLLDCFAVTSLGTIENFLAEVSPWAHLGGAIVSVVPLVVATFIFDEANSMRRKLADGSRNLW